MPCLRSNVSSAEKPSTLHAMKRKALPHMVAAQNHRTKSSGSILETRLEQMIFCLVVR
jgi:hypothetical protein